jgi:hypothetical protein
VTLNLNNFAYSVLNLAQIYQILTLSAPESPSSERSCMQPKLHCHDFVEPVPKAEIIQMIHEHLSSLHPLQTCALHNSLVTIVI